jgi:hypothetical protein
MTRLSTDILDQIDRNAFYGVQETNPVGNIHDYLDQLTGETVALSDRRLVKIERLRLIGWSREYTAWDISYVYGRLANGDLVRVDLGESRIVCAGGDAYKRELVKLCQRAGRFGKALGIFDAVSTLRG